MAKGYIVANNKQICELGFNFYFCPCSRRLSSGSLTQFGQLDILVWNVYNILQNPPELLPLDVSIKTSPLNS